MSVLETITVPRRAETLLQSLGADRELADDILGDLAEEFAVRCRWDGARVARRWYYREALRTAPHLVRDWRHRFRAREAAPLIWAVLAGYAADALVASLLMRLTFAVTGIPLVAYLRHWQITGDLMLWLAVILLVRQIVPAMTGGFVAGTIGKRAALPFSMLASGAILASGAVRMLVASPGLRVFGTVMAVNGGMLVTSCFAGGIVAALWLRRQAAT